MAAEEFDIQKRYERKKEEERQKEKGVVENKKRVVHVIKLYISPGLAKPGPPLGPVLGQHQLNTVDFCKQFNALTAKLDQKLVLPVVVLKRADKTFDISLRNPTVSYYIGQFLSKYKRSTNRSIIITLRHLIAPIFFYSNLNTQCDHLPMFKQLRIIFGSMRSSRARLESNPNKLKLLKNKKIVSVIADK